ncbi:tRNA pseudouridine synthase B [compost metagenome]
MEQAQEQSIAPSELLDPLLMPMDSPAEDFPEVNLLPAVAGYVKQGQPVQVAGAPASGLVRITEGEERKFIGIGEIADDGRVAPRRLVVEYFD